MTRRPASSDRPGTGTPPASAAPIAGDVASHAGGARVLDLLRVMTRLRGPEGCPWDREQTHRSLARHLLEETHEAIEAIERDDREALKDELGDLLLQVVFHAEMARQEGDFDVDDVAEAITAKLIRRHPHVFGDVEVGSAAQVLVNWERIKAEQEGREHGVDEQIPVTLPALARAAKVQRRAAGFGFDWRTVDGALGKVHEELRELEDELRSAGIDRAGADRAAPSGAEEARRRVEDELGDLLLAVTALARRAGVDAETALRSATRRFAGRFDAMRARAREEGVDLADLSDADLLERFRRAGRR